MTPQDKSAFQAQEIFDTVVAHLRKQGCKSQDNDGNCLYRGPNNTKCAVGCLIPDNEYKEDFEGKSITRFDLQDQELVDMFILNRRLLIDLQAIHDCQLVKSWETKFQELAENYNLKYEKPLPGGSCAS